MHRFRGRLTYSNVVSTLCLVLLLGGGTAYAASRLGKESVGAAQLKKGAVTPSKLSRASRLALSGATGAPGPNGAQGIEGKQGKEGTAGTEGRSGTPATAIWANLNSDGSLRNASPAYVSSSAISGFPGAYEVTFDRDVSACAYSANAYDSGFTVELQPRSLNPDAVFVYLQNGATHEQDPFSLAVFC